MTARVWAPIIGMIILAVIIAVVILVLNRRKNRQENLVAGRAIRGDLNQKHEQALMQQLDHAHDIFVVLDQSTSVDTASFISGRHRELIDIWQAEYIKLNNVIG